MCIQYHPNGEWGELAYLFDALESFPSRHACLLRIAHSRKQERSEQYAAAVERLRSARGKDGRIEGLKKIRRELLGTE